MMICHCSMAGTQACINCPRYREYFGEQIKRISRHERLNGTMNFSLREVRITDDFEKGCEE